MVLMLLSTAPRIKENKTFLLSLQLPYNTLQHDQSAGNLSVSSVNSGQALVALFTVQTLNVCGVP